MVADNPCQRWRHEQLFPKFTATRRKQHSQSARQDMAPAKRKRSLAATPALACLVLLLLIEVSAPCWALPNLSGLRQTVEWNSSDKQPVFVAKSAQLSSNQVNLSSLVVEHNFTSDQWKTCPFTNWTCSSEVAPSSKLLLCASQQATNVIDVAPGASVLAPDVTVLDIAQGSNTPVSSAAANISVLGGNMTVLAWVKFPSSGSDAEILKTTILSQFITTPLDFFSLRTEQKGTKLRLAFGGSGVPFWLFSVPSYLLQENSTWYHIAVTQDSTNSRAYVNSEELPLAASSPSATTRVSGVGGEVILGGSAAITIASLHIVPATMSAADVQCVYGCLERFAMEESSGTAIQVTSTGGGQRLLVTGRGSKDVYQSALRSIYLVSYEPLPDPLPRTVMVALSDDCSSADYHIQVYQPCVNSSAPCPSDSRCLENDDIVPLCINATQLLTNTMAVRVSDACPQAASPSPSPPTLAAGTTQAALNTFTGGSAVSAATAGSAGRVNVTGDAASTTAAPGVTTQVVSTTTAGDSGGQANDRIISGVSDGFAIAIIVISIVIAVLLTTLVSCMIRHYRAQQMMVVGGGDDMSPGQKTNTARRRYVYRSYAETQAVQLQSTTAKRSSLYRGGGEGSQRGAAGGTVTASVSAYDDFGMSPQDLESDPRPEVRDLTSAFFRSPVPANVFFKPSIVPLKRNAFSMGGVPGEGGDRQAMFAMPRRDARDNEDLSRMPDGSDVIQHRRESSDPFAGAIVTARHPSKGSSDWSFHSQDELETGLVDEDANLRVMPTKMQSSRDNLHLEVSMDDKVLELVRTGTKRQRRGSLTGGTKRHGPSRHRLDAVDAVVIGNHLTSVI